MHFNQITLMGHLTRNPDLRYLATQMPVVEFGMAVNKKYKGKDGQEREKVLFIDCRLFGEGAKVVNDWCVKGSALFVQGELEFEQWKDRELGTPRSKHLVTVETFQFVGNRPQKAEGKGGGK